MTVMFAEESGTFASPTLYNVRVCGADQYVAQAPGTFLWTAQVSILRHIFRRD